MNSRRAVCLRSLAAGIFFALIGQPVLLHAQSSRPGMGSTLYNGGVTFRVWAPNATNVFVAGTFNTWSTTANPLVSEGTNGVWSADVAGVPVGAEYKYYLNGNLFKQHFSEELVVGDVWLSEFLEAIGEEKS
jgi:hypothetical protein